MVSARSLFLGIVWAAGSLQGILHTDSSLVKGLFLVTLALGAAQCLLSVVDLSQKALKVLLGIESIYYLGCAAYAIVAISPMGWKFATLVLLAGMIAFAMSTLYDLCKATPAP